MLNFDLNQNEETKTMKYRSQTIIHSFSRLLNLFIIPKKEWNAIAQEETSVKSLFLYFAIPLIAACSIISFFGVLIHTKSIGVSISQLFVSFFSLIVGLFFAAKIIILLAPNFQLTIKPYIIFQLIIYSGAAFCVFHGIAKLFSPYSFLNQICLLCELYFIRILWIGTTPLLPIAENKKPGFTIMASLLVLVLPLIFDRMFSILFKLPVTI